MKLNSTLYDRLKFIALIVLPALAVLYLGLGQLWDWPATEQVVASIVLLDTFLGTLLQISTSQYNKSDAAFDGYISSNSVDEHSGMPNLQMTITNTPDVLLASDVVRLRVRPSDEAE